MSVPEKIEGPKGTEPGPPKPKGMTPEERRLFEESFKQNEEALRRLAKL
jgi:hypothetical protein